MKIFNTNINENFPPTYQVLFDLLVTLNPKVSEKDIVKEIKKLGIYDVPTNAPKSKKGKGVDTSNLGNADNIQ
jgi:hypothetical protein